MQYFALHPISFFSSTKMACDYKDQGADFPTLFLKKMSSSLIASLSLFTSGFRKKQSHWGEAVGKSTQDQEWAVSVAVRTDICQV